MKKSNNVLIVDKTDINKQSETKKVCDWTRQDLRTKSFNLLNTSDIVIGIDEDGNTNILKNRWGNMGIVVSQNDYDKFIKPNYENSKSGNTSKKEHIMGRIFKFDFWPFN
jgi:hypothetical protein